MLAILPKVHPDKKCDLFKSTTTNYQKSTLLKYLLYQKLTLAQKANLSLKNLTYELFYVMSVSRLLSLLRIFMKPMLAHLSFFSLL